MDHAQSPLRVAIVGAGIGGLALAIGCIRQNVPYTLYESASEYASIGAGVGFGPNSLKAMDLIDSRFRGLYNQIKTGNATAGKDHVMSEAVMTEEGFGEKRGWMGECWGAEVYERTSAHRKALLDIMTSLIPIDTVRFNKRVTSMEQRVGKVVLTFQDGEVVEASAVIGCDGIKGASRKAVLGQRYPDQVEPTYSGKYVYRSIVPMKDAKNILGRHAGDAKMFMGPKANFASYPISKGTEYNVVAFRRDSGPWTHKELTMEVTREEMEADFSHCDQRLVKLLDWAKPVRWSIWHHLTTPIYYNNLVCLLGDVAHATTPHQAQGAGQGLEDALVLSNLLGLVARTAESSPSINRTKLFTTAFKIYDSIRRPRAQKVVQTSMECGLLYNFLHPECGDDMRKIVDNLNRRYLWIWEHDLEGDVRKAEEEFRKAIMTIEETQDDRVHVGVNEVGVLA